MSDAEHERAIAVDRLLRPLADFSDKLALAARDLVWWLWGIGVVATALIVEVTSWVREGAPIWLFVVCIFVSGVVARLVSGGRITAVQLAAWRLRQVYEIASRLNDMDIAPDPIQRLEFELRLSEAQFLLNRVEWWGPPSSKAARMVLRQRPEKPIAAAGPVAAGTSNSDDSESRSA